MGCWVRFWRVRYAGSGIATAVPLVVSLTACTSPFQQDEPDLPSPEPAVDRLATGLGEGDLSEVAFTDATAADADDFADVVELMGSTDYVVRAEAGEVVEGPTGRRRRRPPPSPGPGTSPAPATRRRAGPTRRRRGLTLAGDSWQVAWERALVEPSLNAGAVLDVTTIRAARGADHRRSWRGPGRAAAGHPLRDRQGAVPARAGDPVGPRARRAAGHRRGGVRQGGRGGRREGLRRGAGAAS